MSQKMRNYQTSVMNRSIVWCLLVVAAMSSRIVTAQDLPITSQYLTGTEEKLEMVVHVWGEVKDPGEMKVPYNTNILQLISKAGGPTTYADLGKVRLTRESDGLKFSPESMKNLMEDAKAGKIAQDKLEETIKAQYSHRIQVYNLKKYLQSAKDFNPPIVLRPGDVVFVPHNAWYRWTEMVRISQQIAVIASVYVWYLRAENF